MLGGIDHISMETIIFGWLPIVIGMTIIGVGSILISRYKSLAMRLPEALILFIVVVGTYGQAVMVIQETWPTYLFIIIIGVCGFFQMILYLIGRKSAT